MRLRQLVVSCGSGDGKPANLWFNVHIYTEAKAPSAWPATLCGWGKGDCRVSHGALPGRWRWV